MSVHVKLLHTDSAQMTLKTRQKQSLLVACHVGSIRHIISEAILLRAVVATAGY